MGYGKEKMYSLGSVRGIPTEVFLASARAAVVHGRPAAGDSLRRVCCVYGAGDGVPAGRRRQVTSSTPGRPLQRGTPQMVRRSFRGREGPSSTEGTASSWDTDRPPGRGLSAGRSAGGTGGSCRKYQAARDRQVASSGRRACGRAPAAAATGGGVRRQDQPSYSCLVRVSSRAAPQIVRKRRSCSWKNTSRWRLSGFSAISASVLARRRAGFPGGHLMVQGKLEAAGGKGAAQGLRRKQVLKLLPFR